MKWARVTSGPLFSFTPTLSFSQVGMTEAGTVFSMMVSFRLLETRRLSKIYSDIRLSTHLHVDPLSHTSGTQPPSPVACFAHFQGQ